MYVVIQWQIQTLKGFVWYCNNSLYIYSDKYFLPTLCKVFWLVYLKFSSIHTCMSVKELIVFINRPKIITYIQTPWRALSAKFYLGIILKSAWNSLPFVVKFVLILYLALQWGSDWILSKIVLCLYWCLFLTLRWIFFLVSLSGLTESDEIKLTTRMHDLLFEMKLDYHCHYC